MAQQTKGTNGTNNNKTNNNKKTTGNKNRPGRPGRPAPARSNRPARTAGPGRTGQPAIHVTVNAPAAGTVDPVLANNFVALSQGLADVQKTVANIRKPFYCRVRFWLMALLGAFAAWSLAWAVANQQPADNGKEISVTLQSPSKGTTTSGSPSTSASNDVQSNDQVDCKENWGLDPAKGGTATFAFQVCSNARNSDSCKEAVEDNADASITAKQREIVVKQCRSSYAWGGKTSRG